jgi:hypothetical protein
MVITKVKDSDMNLEYCELKQNTLEDSIKLYNYMMIHLRFTNPIGLGLNLSLDPFTSESAVIVISMYSDVNSDEIKEYLLGFFN